MTPRQSKTGRDIATYEHADKERVNNPPVGLVTPETDEDARGKSYAHDPHLDPELSWAGKAEHTSFEVPTVSCMSTSGSTRAPSSRRYESGPTRMYSRRYSRLRKKTHRSAKPSSSTDTDTIGPIG